MKHTSFCGRGLSPLILATSLAAALPASSAIVFTNADLEGTAPTSATIPTGWEVVPFDAPYSQAASAGAANGDVVGATGPNVAGNLFGAAHSGDTFFGGAHSSAASTIAHEGIQQTVSGFTVGQEYSFSFFQAYVGTNNARDAGGTWQVYANGVLLTTTLANTSTLAYNDASKGTALPWEERTVTFTATAESMTLGFLAYDPDGDISPQNGTYMGIDSFSEITAVPEPAVSLLGAFGVLGLLRRRRN